MDKIALASQLQLKVSSYYTCHYPLVDLHLRHNQGRSMLSLLPNADFWSIPVFSVDTTDVVPNLVIQPGSKLFEERMDIFELTTTPVSSFPEGIAQISASIKRNQPVILSGTTYELPHSPDFHNPNYLKPSTNSIFGGSFMIGDHYITVIGIGAEEVFIYDPIPNNFLGTISLESLEKFWRGNLQFPEFTQAKGYSLLVTYGIINVTIGENYQNEKFDLVAINVLNKVNTAFLEGLTRIRTGRLYLSGVALNTYIYEAFYAYYSTSGEIPQSLGKCLFDMRWSRYYLRDFLHDLHKELNLPLSELVDEMLMIVQLWEEVYRSFLTIVRKNSQVNHTQVQEFINFLAGVIKREKEFHCQIQDWLSKTKVG
jgi:hypothetical protein